jgi:hypothetical protein
MDFRQVVLLWVVESHFRSSARGADLASLSETQRDQATTEQQQPSLPRIQSRTQEQV